MMEDRAVVTLTLGIVFAVVGLLALAVYSNYGAYYRAGYCVHGIVTLGAPAWTHYSKPPKCGLEVVVPR